MKHTTRRLTALLLLLALTVSLLVPSASAGVGTGQEQLERLRAIDELLTTVYLYGVEPYSLPDSLAERLENDTKLYDITAAAMFARLDAYSHYMSAEEYDIAYPPGERYIGIGISMDPGAAVGVYIAELVSGGPAEVAGLQVGDLIIEADGVDLRGMRWDMASDILRGEEDSVAELTVIRAGEPAPLSFSVKRRALTLPNVTAQNLGDGVGYIRIDRFASIWDHIDFYNYYTDFPYEGVRSVIIDLRNNPGGSVEVAANMLNVFFETPELPLFQLEYAGYDPEVYAASGGRMWKPNALIVLVNEYSASSAELFAGVLQAQGEAVTLGEKTYGKARGQFHIPLDDDSVAIITVSKIAINELPDYHEVGITPTITVPLEKIQYPMPEFTPLGLDTGVYRTSTLRTRALEERLYELGYFTAEPDTTFDDYTRFALHNFQRASGLPLSDYADIATLEVLERAVALLANLEVYIDSQMERAYEIALEAAKKPLTGTLPKRDFSALPAILAGANAA